MIERDNGYEAYMLFEYCPHGTLFDVMEANARVGLPGITNETELVRIIHDIAGGLMVLHEMQISHRDVKLENVLIGEDGRFKLCDFGSASLLQYNTEMTTHDREELLTAIEQVTTPMYRAPELCDKY